MRLFYLLLLIIFSSLGAFAQCYSDRHNTSQNSNWLSCSSSISPNTTRGSSHWVMYNLPQREGIGSIHIWNYSSPDLLNRGARNIIVDFSDDGVNWTEIDQLLIPKATESAFYEGTEVGDLLGKSAKYILITLVDNYGDSCYGLGEVRITTHDYTSCVAQHILPGNITAQSYHADQEIISDGTSQTGTDVYFNAGQEILLNPGFEVEIGSRFVASIMGCD